MDMDHNAFRDVIGLFVGTIVTGALVRKVRGGPDRDPSSDLEALWTDTKYAMAFLALYCLIISLRWLTQDEEDDAQRRPGPGRR